MSVKKQDLSKGIYQSLSVDALKLPDNKFYYRSKDKKSIGFNIDVSHEVSEFFVKTFNLKNPDNFRDKFKQSISGDGGELLKNNALHSSSLCALLMFYNVSEETPFYVVFPDETKHKYTNVYFEVKNKVIKNPSNMDVVLTNDHEILFIECKFSEYLSTAKTNLGKGYLENPKYKEIFEKIEYDKATVFQYGIKQLVSHYIGIKNFQLCNYTKRNIVGFYGEHAHGRDELYNKQYKNVAFMEVIFELPVQQYGEYLKETEKVFNYLIKTDNSITFLGTTTYKELFQGKNRCILSDLVASYYNIDK